MNPPLTLGGIDSKGWVAGGQAGYNWQFGRWVAGLEVDGSATRNPRRARTARSEPRRRHHDHGHLSDDVKYLGTVRTRVGGAVPFANTDVLLYGTAGLAWERVNRIDANAFRRSRGEPDSSPSDTAGSFRLGCRRWR